MGIWDDIGYASARNLRNEGYTISYQGWDRTTWRALFWYEGKTYSPSATRNELSFAKTEEEMISKLTSQLKTILPPLLPKPCAKEGQLQDPLIDSGCCEGLIRDPAGVCRKPAPPPRECGVGETRCKDGNLEWCRDGIWTIQQYGAPQCKPEPTCRKEGERVTFPYVIRCCEGLVQDFWGVCRVPTPPEPVPPEPVPPEPVPPEPVPPEKCPRGAMYTRGFFEECDPGYIAQRGADQQWWEVPNLCVCTEDYEPPPRDALEISALIPLVLIIGAVILVLGMIKR